MNKWLVTSMVFILLIFAGCSTNGMGMVGDKPPKASINIGNESYETTLGTYCWSGNGKGICADTAGPVELLEGKEPIKVRAGEDVTFVMDFEPQPNEIHVVQINGNTETEVAVKNNRFTAPTEKGVYYYSYGVWWMDEKQANVSHGDAFYAFALEVE